MGTNYYIEFNPGDPGMDTLSDHCDRPGAVHIGKSSFGWVFALRIHPDLGIRDLDDWVTWFVRPGIRIMDEYGSHLTPMEMLKVITNRRGKPREDWPYTNRSWEEFHKDNHSTWGPNDLVRHKPHDQITWGSGTWDCINWDFS